MVKRYNFKTSKSEADRPSDEALLSLLQTNMQRLPLNDNASWTARAKPLGVVASIGSYVAYVAILLMGAFILLIFKLVPASKDSDY